MQKLTTQKFHKPVPKRADVEAFDYLYGIYGTQEHGSVGQFRSFFNPVIGPAQVFSGNVLIGSPQNLTTHTARFFINFKLD